MAETVERRVSTLERVLARFITQSNNSLNRLESEMRDFKDEMQEFKDEMSDFKDEMRDFKKEMQDDRKQARKEWAALANKLGTFAEDIALPNIPRMAKEMFGQEIILTKMSRVDIQNPNDLSQTFEFDGIVVGDTKVFLLEAKFTVREKYLNELSVMIDRFKLCFPQYDDKELITVFGSMHIHENSVKKLTKMGIYAMSLGEENMDLLNFDELQKRKK